MKLIIGFLTIIFMSYSSFSAHYYVNGAIGNDENTGQDNTEQGAFKTIKRALKSAVTGDVVHVVGMYDDEQITYYESNSFTDQHRSMEIVGVDKPIIDGDFEEKSISQRNGFSLYTDNISIKGFVFRNFYDIYNNPEQINGAAIYSESTTAKHFIEYNTIENCNYGIFLDGPAFAEIHGNEIRNIKRISPDSDFFDGTGIVVFPSGIGIEGNNIGGKDGNLIENCELYGICIGADSMKKVADLSRIANNEIKNCSEAGLALIDLSGIIEVEKNIFEGNYVSLELIGENFDTWIGSNDFRGAKSDSEIITDTKFNGVMLYDIWIANDNKFNEETYIAATNGKFPAAVITKYGGFIRTNKEKAESDAGEKFQVHDWEQALEHNNIKK